MIYQSYFVKNHGFEHSSKSKRNFGNNLKQPLDAIDFSENNILKEDYQKVSKKFFLSNPVSFDGQNYQKQKGLGDSD